MTDNTSRNPEQLTGRGKFYDPQGRFVDECSYRLEATPMEPHQIEKDGLPDFVTLEVKGTITSELLGCYVGLRMPLTLELSDGRFLRFRNPGGPELNSVYGYGFYSTRAHDRPQEAAADGS